MCIAGGVDAVLCRLRNIDEADKARLAGQARQVCRQQQVPFVISHDVELAHSCGADGVQFGKADGELEELGRLAGEGMPWGYSSHSIDEARQAIDAGAGWVFLGPVFATPEKLKYGPPLGLETVTEAMLQSWSDRLVFIGGIKPDNLGDLLRAGARRVAAISALQSTENPQLIAEQFRLCLEEFPLSRA